MAYLSHSERLELNKKTLQGLNQATTKYESGASERSRVIETRKRVETAVRISRRLRKPANSHSGPPSKLSIYEVGFHFNVHEMENFSARSIDLERPGGVGCVWKPHHVR